VTRIHRFVPSGGHAVNMTRVSSVLVGVLAATGMLTIAGCGGGGSGADLAAGREVYASQCASCHGPSGEGGRGPSLVGVGRVFETAEGQEAFVKTGGAGMPVFGQILTDEQVRDVVAYTRETFR